jgi:hypothetical protein
MFCKANGMDLFDISSEEPKTFAFNFANDTFDEDFAAIMHVKGRDTGECQYITNKYGPFEASYGFCYDVYYLLCGFKNQAMWFYD